ncbi:MAG TPA: hypothetical protein PLW32_00630 [Chitinophagaceae bacterium]|jgi:hypothetical protein|nr:hypothetical protein [Chitinophagaceae bacterium]HPH22357.1 hypothetical protein [Chitinophagaceae bacterium]
MKISNNKFLNQLSNSEMVSLTKQVKETVATNVQGLNKVFSAADLWKIQSNRRVRVTRRMFA